MAKNARIHQTSAVNQVMLRGNGGQNIFFDEPDRIRFYDLVEEGVKRSTVCTDYGTKSPSGRGT